LLVPESCGLVGVAQKVFSKFWVNVALTIATAIVHKFATEWLFNEQELFEYPNYGLWSISLIWNLVGWSIIIYSLLWGEQRVESASHQSPRFITNLLILSLFIFAMTPYIGLRTYPALAMFSNLKTEGIAPNSWIKGLDWFDYQKDYVTVTATNIPAISNLQIDLGERFPEKLKDTNMLFNVSSEFYICPPKWPFPSDGEFRVFSVPFIELRRRIAGGVISGYVEYTRHHTNSSMRSFRFDSESVGEDDELLEPLNLFEQTFVRFRSFSDHYSPCRH
jgi:hypothetical protein